MRADKYFAEKFGSRTKAKEALAEGRILKNGKPLSPHDEITEGESYIILDGKDFVSNGGRKLERGLDVFGVDVVGKVFADLGASTGGFTDCLLRRGAKRVYCVDVGESLLSERIARDDRVRIMDKTNARYLKTEDFPESLDAIVSDLSFISLRLVLPAIHGLLAVGGQALVLFKPQFECGKNVLGKSGILPHIHHKGLLSAFYDDCTALGFAPINIVNAPVQPKKNIEYVVLLEKEGMAIGKEVFLHRAENLLESIQKI